MKSSTVRSLVTVATVLCLTACGGDNLAPQGNETRSDAFFATTSGSSMDTAAQTATPRQAARFLGQATMGPSIANIDRVAQIGPEAWLGAEFIKNRTSHRGLVTSLAALLPPGVMANHLLFFQSFWKQVITADDQLRQRIVFALSQIMVVSFQDSNVYVYPRGMASYYDTLGEHAFGNFRDLLQAVAQHPMMGVYLSHMHNQKEGGYRVPDENFAREVMQLFSIGLYQLNQDGSLKLNNGAPIETYTRADVAGLAKIFTGWSWAGPDKSDARFFGSKTASADYREWTAMQMYPNYHSTSEKKFLGVTVSGSSDGVAETKLALDTLFNHPNVGPFIGKQLIQRLVTSNPSPAYIARVAGAFANNGSGVRGDMKAVISAILLDPEARSVGADGVGTASKLREPVVRIANWMRAFNTRSHSGNFTMGATDDPLTGLGQTPLRSPSVFNFYRPGYVAPNSAAGSAGLVSPEMQITSEPSVIGYINYIYDAVPYGVGNGRDIYPNYNAEVSLAATPDKLLDRIDLLMLGGAMSPTLRAQILDAISSIRIPAQTLSNTVDVTTAKERRVYAAIFLTMSSPEYLVQK